MIVDQSATPKEIMPDVKLTIQSASVSCDHARGRLREISSCPKGSPTSLARA